MDRHSLSPRGISRWVPASLAAVLIVGTLLTWWTIRQADSHMREDLLEQTRLVARAVDPQRVKALSGTAADLAAPDYLRLKHQLAAILASNPSYRFIYLMGRRADGAVFFFADSEPAGSEDESPAGQIYPEATPEVILSFETKAEFSEGPVTDRWGTWVSSRVPILDPVTDDLAAFLGIDIDAARWGREALGAGWVPALLTLLWVVILSAIAWFQLSGSGKRSRMPQGRCRIEIVMTAALGVTLSFAVAWASHQGEQRRYREAFFQLADTSSDQVAKTIGEIGDIGLESLASFFSASRQVTQQEYRQYAAYLEKNPAVCVSALVAVVPEDRKSLFEQEICGFERPDFRLWQMNAQGVPVEAAGRPVHYPIVNFHPLSEHLGIPGYDLGAVPAFRAALEETARSGLVTAIETGAVIPGTDCFRGMPVFKPVYCVDRPRTLRGFALVVVRIEALLRRVNGFGPGKDSSAIDLALLGLAVDAPAVRLAATGETKRNRDGSSAFHFIRPVLAFGKTFAVAVTPGPAFKALHPARAGWMTALAGLVITAALALVVGFVVHRREDLERQVQERTAALQESEARLRAIFDSAPDAVYLKDVNLRYTHCNKAFERIFGLRREQILGRTAAEIFPGEDTGTITAMDRQALSGNPNRSTWTRRIGETEITVDTTKAPVRDAEGKIVGMCGVSRDISEQIRLEAEKTQLAEQVRQSQKMESVGRLAGGVAHDFNNLLSVILGYAELVALDLPEGQPLGRKVRLIHDAAIRARDLTRQLLAFSRKQVLEIKPVDLNAVVGGFNNLLHRLIGEDIALELALAHHPLPILADAAQLEQVLMNLAVNARDAMVDGGRLTIETATVALDETYIRKKPGIAPGHYAMLAVSDTGCGMSAEMQALIFEPFFTTKEKEKGTGLGLATCYGIVKQHEGAIWVYSEPGRGTTFKIYLPLCPGLDATDPGDICLPPSKATGGATVLVVEDDPLLRELAAKILGGHGYTVMVAETAADAVALAEDCHGGIDLVLTDVVMPEMKGPEVFEKVKRVHPHAGVLYMSGYTDNVIVRHGVLKPGVRFLQKPFAIDGLLQKVAEVLAERR